MRLTHLVTVVVVASLGLSGCASPVGDSGVGERPATVRLYGTDGIMQDAFGSELADPTLLNGMKGTAPLNPLPSEFTNRLRGIDPQLTGFQYAGETYDAVVISALAAELAGTPDPTVVRGYINAVTTGGAECTTVGACLALARDSQQLAYRGVSVRRGGFTDRGEPAAATYATLHFGREGLIDQDKTEFVGAGDLSAITAAEPPQPVSWSAEPGTRPDPLKIGGLLPETGDLSFAYPPLIAAAQLAIAEINEAGGVFGVDVEWVDGDDGTDPEVARATIASHVAEGVHVILGAAASGVSQAVLPDVIAAERILFSPSNTAAALTTVDDGGFYFRTAPSDDLQGAAVADIMLRDGNQRIVIVARDDAYGRGLQSNAHESLIRFGVPNTDIHLLTYAVSEDGEPLRELARLIDDIIDAQADAVLVIGFSEAAQVIERMVAAGLLAGS